MDYLLYERKIKMRGNRRFIFIVIALVLLCALSGCERSGEAWVIVNNDLGLKLEIPGEWEDIAVVTGYSKNWDSDRTGSAAAFTLYEKSAYEDSSTGVVWGIQVYPLGAEMEYDVDEVITVNGRFVIGDDEEWRYLAYLPTDIQYLLDDEVSAGNYKQLQEESPAVIEEFLEKNGISANETGLRELAAALVGKGEKSVVGNDPEKTTEELVDKVKSLQNVIRWFTDGCSGIEIDGDTQHLTEDGTAYVKVVDPYFTAAGIHSVDSLKKYLCGYFTVEYVDELMEEHDSLFVDVGDDLYVLAATGAASYVLKSPEFLAEYITEDKVRLKCEVVYQLFSGEPEPRVLEFEFVEVDGEWLCCSSPDVRDWSRILFDEGELAVDIFGSEWSLNVYPEKGNMIFTHAVG